MEQVRETTEFVTLPGVSPEAVEQWKRDYARTLARISARVSSDLLAGKTIVCRFCHEPVRLVGEPGQQRDVCGCPELSE